LIGFYQWQTLCGFGNFNLFKESVIRSAWKEKCGSKNAFGWGADLFLLDRLLFSSVSFCFRWWLPEVLRLPTYDRTESLVVWNRL